MVQAPDSTEYDSTAFEYAVANGLATDPSSIDTMAIARTTLERTLMAINNDAWLARDWSHLFTIPSPQSEQSSSTTSKRQFPRAALEMLQEVVDWYEGCQDGQSIGEARREIDGVSATSAS